ncbi:MAG: DUF1501 domain-containing protein [Rothia sp. (in: high G+C Gram-positive bacteria)]|nr:DUF1501 domain-containing protein [Rothia sp. (in: high G+C Gram-positive bacteria)]
MKPLNTLFLKDDSLHQVHHHSGDDSRNFLVDIETGENIGSITRANQIALERLQKKEGRRGLNRRTLLTGAGAGVLSLSSMMLTESIHPRYAYADTPLGDGTVLVVVYLRGGADGLSLVTPYNDKYYTANRKTTRKTLSMNGAYKLNDTFMLAPEMKGLKEAWIAGDLSITHSVGIDKNTRSHFSNYTQVDRSAPVQYKTGWLARLLDTTADNQSQFRAFSHASRVAGAFFGADKDILAINSFTDFKPASVMNDKQTINVVANRIAKSVGGALGNTAQETLNAMGQVQKLVNTGYTPANGAVYPQSGLGASMKDVAQIIKANKGVQVVTVDQGDWDTHRGQRDRVNVLAKELGDSLGAFYKDMGKLRMQKIVVMTVSEFGRTTIENGSQGTDHGAGNFSFILSGKATGKIAGGLWSGLKNSEDKDNAIHTDYRSVAAEVMKKGLGIDDARIAQIFPAFTPKPVGVLG